MTDPMTPERLALIRAHTADCHPEHCTARCAGWHQEHAAELLTEVYRLTAEVEAAWLSRNEAIGTLTAELREARAEVDRLTGELAKVESAVADYADSTEHGGTVADVAADMWTRIGRLTELLAERTAERVRQRDAARAELAALRERVQRACITVDDLTGMWGIADPVRDAIGVDRVTVFKGTGRADRPMTPAELAKKRRLTAEIEAQFDPPATPDAGTAEEVAP